MKILYAIIILILLHGCVTTHKKGIHKVKEVHISDSGTDDTTAATIGVGSFPTDSTAASGGGSGEESSYKEYADKSSHADKSSKAAKSDKTETLPKPQNHEPITIAIHLGHANIIHMPDTIAMVIEPSETNVGGIAYYIPDTMKVGVIYKVSLRLSKHLSASISAGLPSVAVVKPIRVGSSMSAVITDEDPDKKAFAIDTLNTAVQSIENDSSYTTWEWTVKPLKSGKHKLKLMVVIKTADITKDIPVYEDNIYIVASPIYSVKAFVSTNWKWMMSTLVIPFIVFLWKRRKKKKDEPEDSETEKEDDKPESENG